MITIIFKSKLFYLIVLILLLILIMLNLYTFYTNRITISLIPAIIQIILLIMLIFKHRYSKIFLKIWLILFLIISSSLQLIGRLMKDLSYNFHLFNIQNYILNLCTLLFGILLLYYAEKTIKFLEE